MTQQKIESIKLDANALKSAEKIYVIIDGDDDMKYKVEIDNINFIKNAIEIYLNTLIRIHNLLKKS